MSRTIMTASMIMRMAVTVLRTRGPEASREPPRMGWQDSHDQAACARDRGARRPRDALDFSTAAPVGGSSRGAGERAVAKFEAEQALAFERAGQRQLAGPSAEKPKRA